MARNSQLQAVPHGAAEADINVLRRLAAGDRDAVAELYDRYAARIMGLAIRIVRNSSDAEDVVQEVFSQAWRTAPNYQPARGTVAGSALLPYEEQRGPRPVLPAEHGVPAEETAVEVPVAERE